MIELDKMNKTDIIEVLKRHGVKGASIFGSVIRGEQHEDSDLDILVQMIEKYSLFDIIDIKLDLEDTLGCKVDVIPADSLHPLIRNEISNEQVMLF